MDGYCKVTGAYAANDRSGRGEFCLPCTCRRGRRLASALQRRFMLFGLPHACAAGMLMPCRNFLWLANECTG